jgi:hypothetical protein
MLSEYQKYSKYYSGIIQISLNFSRYHFKWYPNWKPDHWLSLIWYEWWKPIQRKNIKILIPRWGKTLYPDQVFKILCTRFNAQDSRIILVVVQVEAIKIHVAAVEALKKKERWDETQIITKFMVFQVPNPLPPPTKMLMYFF